MVHACTPGNTCITFWGSSWINLVCSVALVANQVITRNMYLCHLFNYLPEFVSELQILEQEIQGKQEVHGKVGDNCVRVCVCVCVRYIAIICILLY